MADITAVLRELDLGGFVLLGEPTNEQEFNALFRKIVGEDDNGSSILSEDPADFGVTWSQVLAKKPEVDAAQDLALLRNERNRLLAETDWWASSDLTMTAEQTAYRQALRDITETYTSLEDVVWPTKPE